MYSDKVQELRTKMIELKGDCLRVKRGTESRIAVRQADALKRYNDEVNLITAEETLADQDEYLAACEKYTDAVDQWEEALHEEAKSGGVVYLYQPNSLRAPLGLRLGDVVKTPPVRWSDSHGEWVCAKVTRASIPENRDKARLPRVGTYGLRKVLKGGRLGKTHDDGGLPGGEPKIIGTYAEVYGKPLPEDA